MSASYWRTAAIVAAAAAATFGTASADVAGLGPSCGTNRVKAAPVRVSEEGRRSRPGDFSAAPASGFFPSSVEIPAVHYVAPAPAAPTTVAGSTPPAAPAPPAVPGLLPPPPTEKEDKRDRVEAIQASGEIPEGRLLDIGIEVFDPGIDESDRQKLAQQGLSPELRRAESRYVAFHLKTTMEGTGNWGAVRVIPGPGEGLDVFVTGRILKSTGKDLEIEVEAMDATGRRWLRKQYKGTADISAYRPERVGQYEPFQEVYNRIANDILQRRDDLEVEEIEGVRRVAAMRFASQLAPKAFSAYLRADDAGRYSLRRLPAEGDPMVRRVSDIRDRDQMFVDTLNDYYLSFYERMNSPYANWRQYSYQEQAALDKIKRESTLKKILGGAGMLAGLVMSGSDSQGGRLAGDIALLGGMTAIQAGMRQSQDKAIHVAALKELAQSVDGEVAPLLVEVEGQQVKLTGSAEEQFTEWRELLHRVLTVETGIADDPNLPVVVSQPPRD